MWNIIKDSKWAKEIMENMGRIFSFGEGTTDTEIHDKLSSMEPLETQLEAARTEAVAENGKKLADLETRFSALEASVAIKDKEIVTKEARIAEMQIEAADQAKAVEAMQTGLTALKDQHKKEVNTLAGKISSLQAGRVTEQEEVDKEHGITGLAEATLHNKQIPVVDEDLQRWSKPKAKV